MDITLITKHTDFVYAHWVGISTQQKQVINP